MLDLELKCKKTIEEQSLFDDTNYLLLMVSGGCDSIALCYLIDEIQNHNKQFAIMHLNHGIRKDALEDEQFVKDIAKHFGVEVFSYKEDLPKMAKTFNENVEALGHKLRYLYANDAVIQWAELLDKPIDNFKICSAHTLDDRIENFYMRSIVGTGPGGFAGIAYKNDNVIRPLLDVSKQDIKEYLKALESPYKDAQDKIWHEDSTNHDLDKFRAYIRHEIVPRMKEQNANMPYNLLNSMNLIADEDAFMQEFVKKILDLDIDFKNKSFMILPSFYKNHIVLKKRAIYTALKQIFNEDVRIESKSIESILKACETNNYTDNIQCNYAVHSNKKGVLVQPMQDYRRSRNRL